MLFSKAIIGGEEQPILSQSSAITCSSSAKDSVAGSSDSPLILNQEEDEEASNITCHSEGMLTAANSRCFGDKFFWAWEFNVEEEPDLHIINLPRFSGVFADLQLIAASQYRGQLAILPPPLVSLVTCLRETKNFIFGDDMALSDAINFKSYDELVFCFSLARQLYKMQRTFPYKRAGPLLSALYHYRVSLNGVLCGTVPGPEKINRSFIRWIHLRFGLFDNFFLKCAGQEWFTRGFKVYRFTPMPYVTVLRILLRDVSGKKRIIIRISRQAN